MRAAFVLLLVLAIVYGYTDNGLGECFCYSCDDCTAALNDNSLCSVSVELGTDITDFSGGVCINNPENFTNKIFKCGNHKIDGVGNVNSIGILISGDGSLYNNTIENCVISEFGSAIVLNSSANTTITSLTISNTSYGIKMLNSSYNLVQRGMISSSGTGIYMENTSYNSISDTQIKYASVEGITLYNSSYDNFTGNLLNYNGYGFVVRASSNDTFTYNQIRYSSQMGMSIWHSTNLTFTNNVVQYSNENGLYMMNSSNNTITNNAIRLNGGNGIFMGSNSIDNTVETNNLCLNNQSRTYAFDIFVNNAADNTINDLTCDLSNPAGLCSHSCTLPYTVVGDGVCEVGGDCDNLSAALDDSRNCYREVRLTDDITDYSGTCVNNPWYFKNKALNCQGHTIDGTGGNDRGLYLVRKSNITVMNCVIQESGIGIIGVYLSNATFQNVSTVHNFGIDGCQNGVGLHLYESTNVRLIDVNASNNRGGSGSSSGCMGEGAYLNISNSELTRVTAAFNTGGNGSSRGGGIGIGILLVGSNNRINSANCSSNQGGGSSTSGGGSSYGIWLSGYNNYLSDVYAIDNIGGLGSSSNGLAYGIFLYNATNTTIVNSNFNLNGEGSSYLGYGIYLGGGSENNSLSNVYVLNNSAHGIYFDSTSTDNRITSSRACYNNQSGGPYYDVYDDDSNTLSGVYCDTSSPDGLCTYACNYVPPSGSGGGGGTSKRHALKIYSIDNANAKVNEVKTIKISVKNIGDYDERDLLLALGCPSQLTCTNASIDVLERFDEKDLYVNVSGGALGTYRVNVVLSNGYTSAEDYFYFTVEPQCENDNGCRDNEKCVEGVCSVLECKCGYIANHSCIEYECCDNSDCAAGMKCSDHKCVKIEQPKEEQPKEEQPKEEQPKEEQPKEEEKPSKEEKTSVTNQSGTGQTTGGEGEGAVVKKEEKNEGGFGPLLIGAVVVLVIVGGAVLYYLFTRKHR